MHRFFISPEEKNADRIVFSAAHAKQISRVLRLEAGERCVVLDNLGNEWLVELTHSVASSVEAQVVTRSAAEEPETKLTLYISLTQREKFEWILQKGTEVGVSVFQPIITSRTLVQNRKDVEAKYERWRLIIQEAAEQSGRGRLPVLLPALGLSEALQQAAQKVDLRLILWEGEVAATLKQALTRQPAKSVTIFIGPEGGFSAEEVEQAVNAGFEAVTLGKRILRMETAALVSAALVFHELETITPSGAAASSSARLQ